MTSQSGVYVELLANVGYLHVFPAGAVYAVSEVGAHQVVNAGRSNLLVGGTAGFGIDAARTNLALPLTLGLRAGALLETQFSGPAVAHPQLLVCVSYTFAG